MNYAPLANTCGCITFFLPRFSMKVALRTFEIRFAQKYRLVLFCKSMREYLGCLLSKSASSKKEKKVRRDDKFLISMDALILTHIFNTIFLLFIANFEYYL